MSEALKHDISSERILPLWIFKITVSVFSRLTIDGVTDDSMPILPGGIWYTAFSSDETKGSLPLTYCNGIVLSLLLSPCWGSPIYMSSSTYNWLYPKSLWPEMLDNKYIVDIKSCDWVSVAECF